MFSLIKKPCIRTKKITFSIVILVFALVCSPALVVDTTPKYSKEVALEKFKLLINETVSNTSEYPKGSWIQYVKITSEKMAWDNYKSKQNPGAKAYMKIVGSEFVYWDEIASVQAEPGLVGLYSLVFHLKDGGKIEFRWVQGKQNTYQGMIYINSIIAGS